jgi:hypothetical protein
LAHRPQFNKLPKDQRDGFLDTPIWILFEMRRIGLEIADRRRHQELPASRLRPPRFYGALTQ